MINGTTVYPADILKMEKNHDESKDKSSKKKRKPLSLSRLTFHQNHSGASQQRSKSSDRRTSTSPQEIELPTRPGYMNPTVCSQNQRRRNCSGVNVPVGMGGLSGNHMTPAELENRLRTSRMECEQLKVKLGVTSVECEKLSSQVRQVTELKETCHRLQSEMSAVKRRQKADDEYLQRIAELEHENMLLKQQMTSLNIKLDEVNASLSDQETIADRLNHLEEDYRAVSSSQERQRQQYERFVDHIVSQVVQSSLQQKSVNELCLRLQTRLQYVESQNQCLAQIIRNQMVNSNSPHSIGSSNGSHRRIESLHINSGTYTKSIKNDKNESGKNLFASEKSNPPSNSLVESPFRPVTSDGSPSSQSFSASAPLDNLHWSDSLEQMPSANPALSLGFVTPAYYQIDFTTLDSNSRIANHSHNEFCSHPSGHVPFHLHNNLQTDSQSLKVDANPFKTELRHEETLTSQTFSSIKNGLSSSSSKEQQLTISDNSSSNSKTGTSSSQEDSDNHSSKLPTSFDSNAEEVSTITKQVVQSTSFTKDDGYSSMPCDNAIASPLTSRRELSTVGEQRGLEEEEHHKETSDLGTSTKILNSSAKPKGNTSPQEQHHTMKSSFQSDVSTISYVSSSSLEPDKVFHQEVVRNEILDALKTLSSKSVLYRDQKHRYLTCSRRNERFNRYYKKSMDMEMFTVQQHLTVHQRQNTFTSATDVYSDTELMTERFIITSSIDSHSELAEEEETSTLGLSNVEEIDIVCDTTASSRISQNVPKPSSKSHQAPLFSPSFSVVDPFEEEYLEFFEDIPCTMAYQMDSEKFCSIPLQSYIVTSPYTEHSRNERLSALSNDKTPLFPKPPPLQPIPLLIETSIEPSSNNLGHTYQPLTRNYPPNYDNLNPSFISITSSSESERTTKQTNNSKARVRKSLPCPKSVPLRSNSPIPTSKLTSYTKSNSQISPVKSSARRKTADKVTRPSSQIIRPSTNHSFPPPPLSAPPIPPRTTSRLGDPPVYSKKANSSSKECDKSPSKSLSASNQSSHSSKIPRSTKTPPKEQSKSNKTHKQMSDQVQKSCPNKVQILNANKSRHNSTRFQNNEFNFNDSASLTKSITETEYDPVPEEVAHLQSPELLDLINDPDIQALPTSSTFTGIDSLGVTSLPPPNCCGSKVPPKCNAMINNNKTGIPRYFKSQIPPNKNKTSNGQHQRMSAIDHLACTVSEIEASLIREPLFYKDQKTSRISNGIYPAYFPNNAKLCNNFRSDNPNGCQLTENLHDIDSDSSKSEGSHSSQDLYIDDDIDEQQGIVGIHEFSDSLIGSMDEDDDEDLDDEVRLHELANGDEAKRFMEELQRFQITPAKYQMGRFTDL